MTDAPTSMRERARALIQAMCDGNCIAERCDCPGCGCADAIESALTAARDEGLEMAAELCASMDDNSPGFIADSIRQLRIPTKE